MNYIKKHSIPFLSAFLLIICFLLYFVNMGNYPLIDVDETKYVSVARDMLNSNNWIIPKLNGENFYECPPLLFWLINTSFLFFGEVSAFAARVPMFILCTLSIISLFIATSKILTKTYAFIISLILMTSFGFLVFGRLSTNDMLYTATSMISVLLTYLLLLTDIKINKTILWCIIFAFVGFSMLTGGLFGAIPLLLIIAMHIFAGKLKDVFKPLNIILGIFIVGIITLPWIIVMFKNNGIEFFKESLSYYSLIRNFSIKNSMLTLALFLLGFMPWTFSFLWIIGSKFKDIINSVLSYFKDNSQEKLNEKWVKLTNTDKFLSLNTIVFFTALIFALVFGAKFIFLILFLTFPAACISGHYWVEYIKEKEHDKSIFFATIIPNLLFIICSFIGLFGHNFISKLTLYGFQFLIIPLVIIFFIIPLIAIFAVILKGRIPAFLSNLILMISLSFVLTPDAFNFITINGGENDLINFARLAKENDVKLHTYTSGRKYSLVYYYDGKIEYHSNKDIEWLKTFLHENKEDYVVTEIKELWAIEEANIKYMLLDSGKRYCLIKHLPEVLKREMEKNYQEPEIIIN